jgi:hypothetical protein
MLGDWGFAPEEPSNVNEDEPIFTQKRHIHLDQHSFLPLQTWLLMTTPKLPTLLVRLQLSQPGSIADPFIAFSGGNSLDKAPVGRVHDFVKANGGHTVITKVSIMGVPTSFGHTYSE